MLQIYLTKCHKDKAIFASKRSCNGTTITFSSFVNKCFRLTKMFKLSLWVPKRLKKGSKLSTKNKSQLYQSITKRRSIKFIVSASTFHLTRFNRHNTHTSTKLCPFSSIVLHGTVIPRNCYDYDSNLIRLNTALDDPWFGTQWATVVKTVLPAHIEGVAEGASFPR